MPGRNEIIDALQGVPEDFKIGLEKGIPPEALLGAILPPTVRF